MIHFYLEAATSSKAETKSDLDCERNRSSLLPMREREMKAPFQIISKKCLLESQSSRKFIEGNVCVQKKCLSRQETKKSLEMIFLCHHILIFTTTYDESVKANRKVCMH